jgi:hypothetical protein
LEIAMKFVPEQCVVVSGHVGVVTAIPSSEFVRVGFGVRPPYQAAGPAWHEVLVPVEHVEPGDDWDVADWRAGQNIYTPALVDRDTDQLLIRPANRPVRAL